MKHIKYYKYLEDARKPTRIFKNSKNKGKELGSYPAFPIYTLPQGDHIDNDEKFLFIELMFTHKLKGETELKITTLQYLINRSRH